VLTVGGTVLMTIHPLVLLCLAGIAVVVSILLCRWLYRTLRKVFRISFAHS
jgi:hypothetical protein